MLATSASQLSLAIGNSAWALAIPVASLHSNVALSAPAVVVHVGDVLSVMVMTWVYDAEILPQASVTVHVFV